MHMKSKEIAYKTITNVYYICVCLCWRMKDWTLPILMLWNIYHYAQFIHI